MTDERFYTITELVALLQTSRRTIYRWIDDGLLGAVKVGPKKWLVGESALQEFLKKKV